MLSARGMNSRAIEHRLDEFHQVIREAFGPNRTQVPTPCGPGRLEGDQALVDQLMNELVDEERISTGLLVHQLRERHRARCFTMKGVRNQMRQVVIVQRREHDFLHLGPGLADCREFAH